MSTEKKEKLDLIALANGSSLVGYVREEPTKDSPWLIVENPDTGDRQVVNINFIVFYCPMPEESKIKTVKPSLVTN